jgi:hypothetical protein
VPYIQTAAAQIGTSYRESIQSAYEKIFFQIIGEIIDKTVDENLSVLQSYLIIL